ncbi:hypothetical protein HNV12_12115 [Methanococcoides sp. SA1]|nr:hypothetical protein [Methanococcoides sp. SA1]
MIIALVLWYILIWFILTLTATIWVIYDVVRKNNSSSEIMKVVWVLVAFFFGVFGVAAYYFIGRK